MRPKCPECGSEKVNRGFEEVACGKCGLVIEDNFIMN
ncbi:MAG: hypothetical protein GOV02_00685 [Candidatus Aenigmarchaeota archaeon]|nr:hypothetical protein [Candidatus Aenigmarchaeota archaeon]